MGCSKAWLCIYLLYIYLIVKKLLSMLLPATTAQRHLTKASKHAFLHQLFNFRNIICCMRCLSTVHDSHACSATFRRWWRSNQSQNEDSQWTSDAAKLNLYFTICTIRVNSFLWSQHKTSRRVQSNVWDEACCETQRQMRGSITVSVEYTEEDAVSLGQPVARLAAVTQIPVRHTDKTDIRSRR